MDIEGYLYKFCTTCFNNAHNVFMVDGLPPILKNKLQLRNNEPVKEKVCLNNFYF